MDWLEEIEQRWDGTNWVLDGPTTNSESYDCWYIREEDGSIVAETDSWLDPKPGLYAHKIVAAPVDIARLVAEVKRLRAEMEVE